MTCEISPTDQRLLSSGGLAGILFCGVAGYGILTRSGFDLQRHAISNLSLGEGGWMMVAAFIGSGLLTLLCALGLSRVLTAGPGRRALPILIGIYGIGLVIAGMFPPPACCGFPAGTPDDQIPVMTTGAIIHSMGFMIAFTSLIIACFVAAGRLSGNASFLSLASGVSMPILVGVGMANVVAPGVAFLVAAIIGWVWLSAMSMTLPQPLGASPSTAAASQA
jgi:hypothetical protein